MATADALRKQLRAVQQLVPGNHASLMDTRRALARYQANQQVPRRLSDLVRENMWGVLNERYVERGSTGVAAAEEVNIMTAQRNALIERFGVSRAGAKAKNALARINACGKLTASVGELRQARIAVAELVFEVA